MADVTEPDGTPPPGDPVPNESPPASSPDAPATAVDSPPDLTTLAEQPEAPGPTLAPDPSSSGTPPVDSTAVSADDAPDGADTTADHQTEREQEQAADVVSDIDELTRLAAERDDYLDQLQRLQADFANYRKSMLARQSEQADQAARSLVERLLEVLDTYDLAVAHGGGEAVEQLGGKLSEVLAKEGLERLDPGGQPFDPNEHEAVLHEDGDADVPEVIEVLRAGYRWKGRVIRPAMVKVKG